MPRHSGPHRSGRALECLPPSPHPFQGCQDAPDEPARGSGDGRPGDVLGAGGRGRHEEPLRGVHRDRQGRHVVPALATRWEASPDNKGFRFFLPEGRQVPQRASSRPRTKWTFEQILLPGNRRARLTYLRCWRGHRRSWTARRLSCRASRWSTRTRSRSGSRSPTCFSRSTRSSSWTAGSSRSGADWHTKVWRGRSVQVRPLEARAGGPAGRPQGLLGQGPAIDEIVMLIVPSFDTAVSS